MLVRTLLAVSLSGLMFTSAFAENNNAQLEQLPQSQEIPIENHALSQSNVAPQAQTSAVGLGQLATPTATPVAEEEDASSQADNVTPSSTSTSAPTENKTTATTPATKVEWTLDALNNAEWTEDLQRGQLPVYAKAQVLLNRQHASPGAIDAATGMNTLKALSAYQTMRGLPGTGVLDKATWDKLVSESNNEAVFVEYTITEADLKGPYAKSIPSNYAEQAKMKGLYYTRVTEMLGEKFHMDEEFLKKINPKATFNKVGEKIIVTNVRNTLPEDIHLIVAHKGAKQLYLFNSKNRMIASFPATIGSSSTPSPSGTHTIKSVAPNPWYSYSPSNFVQGNNLKPLSLPPGPNNPVGNMWIGLSKPSFGIHGTPNPSLISKTASHGCIRLTNWDVNDLAKRVKAGITVKFLD